MVWELEWDTFTFEVDSEGRPYTRGVLSTVNSIYDPTGFLAPIVVRGKLFLGSMISDSSGWDDPLPIYLKKKWEHLKNSLKHLEKLHLRRTFCQCSFQQAHQKTVLIFADASEKAIAAVAHLKLVDDDGNTDCGFLMAKAKVAPSYVHTHSIP